MAQAFIGLGGNVGDVVSSMAGALQNFASHQDVVVKEVSSIYKTPPWGIEDQDWFHNACAELETSLQPLDLLDLCLTTERIFKRERRVRWGPRTLDLDILLYDDEAFSSDSLTIPHPRISERAFVVQPLAELSDKIRLNGQGIKDILATLDLSAIDRIETPEDWWRK